jgi:cation:H+ antiporter
MTIATSDLLTLIAAIPLAAIGGASFLNGVLGIAQWLRLPKLLVATTFAAFATSSPEMAVSSMAAIAGKPGIGLGDAFGGNVVNLGLILGVALLFGPLAAHFEEFKRDFMLALAVPILTLVLASNSTLSRSEGVLLLVLFACWLTLLVRQAMIYRRDTPIDTETPAVLERTWLFLLFLLAGLAALLVAGRLFVSGASGIAMTMGLHPYVIGATLVAIGTSLPELVTVLLSRLRGHDDIGIGTLLGSNLFNGLAVVGVTATIAPIHITFGEVAVGAGFGMITVLLLMSRSGMIPRHRAPALIAAYCAFIFMTAAQAH